MKKQTPKVFVSKDKTSPSLTHRNPRDNILSDSDGLVLVTKISDRGKEGTSVSSPCTTQRFFLLTDESKESRTDVRVILFRHHILSLCIKDSFDYWTSRNKSLLSRLSLFTRPGSLVFSDTYTPTELLTRGYPKKVPGT